MAPPLHDVSCASIPAESLRFLAGIRCEPGVLVRELGQRVWLRWESGDQSVLRALTPLADCRLFVFRAGHWFSLGKHVPVDVPTTGYRPLDQVLLPAPMAALPPSFVRGQPLILTLVTEENPRPATALCCSLGDLLTWADTVSNVRLAQLQAAYCGSELLVLGTKLPELPCGRRFWGQSVLVPLGYRLEPGLPDSAVRAILGLEDNDLALLEIDTVDVIAHTALVPMTRAGLRLLKHGARGT